MNIGIISHEQSHQSFNLLISLFTVTLFVNHFSFGLSGSVNPLEFGYEMLYQFI